MIILKIRVPVDHFMDACGLYQAIYDHLIQNFNININNFIIVFWSYWNTYSNCQCFRYPDLETKSIILGNNNFISLVIYSMKILLLVLSKFIP